ncbi:acetolactate synthase, small subunit [Propionibacterium cyclohexanicum]|uniref:Acetolactate synthase small subunit n=1 Tax=Propionibacterium cyclohexanicum TaxID=64702 RepID=A0A1H9QSV2_9ACTN|nr:acetolactate synthase small subunit [Propionibacterium cyclohexanicum]SER63556.1 acetolactate synthase, small subunit [Propionibacterium cyclohexanicum]
MSTHTLSVLVSNHPGVLARVSGLISRRGFNIESLSVGTTERSDVSRMTIVMTLEDDRIVEQVVKQLNKLIEVYKVVELDDDAVNHEMLLVKVRCTDHTRAAVIDITNLFRAHAVDVSPESVTIEATGGRSKIDALMTMLSPHGIIELVQSGRVALGRGAKGINEKKRPGLVRHSS